LPTSVLIDRGEFRVEKNAFASFFFFFSCARHQHDAARRVRLLDDLLEAIQVYPHLQPVLFTQAIRKRKQGKLHKNTK
jgi:hypothetical protein